MAAQGPAGVVQGAQVPVAVPGHLVDLPGQRLGRFDPVDLLVEAGLAFGQAGKALHRRHREPAEPDALATALATETVHAVVPVTAADQRQAMAAPGVAVLQRPLAVFVERVKLAAGQVARIAIVFVSAQRRRLEKGQWLVENAAVTGGLDVLAGDVGQPQQIIRTAAAHATILRWMPPVQHVALLELVGGAGEDMRAGALRVGVQQGQHVLQLIAVADGATGLIEAGAGQNARGQGLVEQPAIDQQIEGRVGGLHLNRTEQAIPVLGDLGQGLLDLALLLPVAGQCRGLLAIAALAEQEHHLGGGAGGDVQVYLERGAGVVTGFDPSAQRPALQPGGTARMAGQAEEILAVGGQAVRRAVGAEERDPLGKLRVPRVAGQQRVAVALVFTDHMGSRRATQRPEQPFGVVGRGDPPWPRADIVQTQPDDLQRIVQGHEHQQLLLQALAVAPPTAVTRTVANLAGTALACRQRRGGPDRRGFLVAQIQRFAGTVGQRVVVPRRQAILAAVQRPAETQAGLADDAAEALIGQHVAPGGRGALIRLEVNQVVAAIGAEAANTVIRAQIARPRQGPVDIR